MTHFDIVIIEDLSSIKKDDEKVFDKNERGSSCRCLQSNNKD